MKCYRCQDTGYVRYTENGDKYFCPECFNSGGGAKAQSANFIVNRKTLQDNSIAFSSRSTPPGQRFS